MNQRRAYLNQHTCNVAFQLLGYLNFFLWASDLWFLYKETLWFQNRIGGGGASSSGMSPGGGHGNI